MSRKLDSMRHIKMMEVGKHLILLAENHNPAGTTVNIPCIQIKQLYHIQFRRFHVERTWQTKQGFIVLSTQLCGDHVSCHGVDKSVVR